MHSKPDYNSFLVTPTSSKKTGPPTLFFLLVVSVHYFTYLFFNIIIKKGVTVRSQYMPSRTYKHNIIYSNYYFSFIYYNIYMATIIIINTYLLNLYDKSKNYLD
jgi:hypothetical protein